MTNEINGLRVTNVGIKVMLADENEVVVADESEIVVNPKAICCNANNGAFVCDRNKLIANNNQP